MTNKMATWTAISGLPERIASAKRSAAPANTLPPGESSESRAPAAAMGRKTIAPKRCAGKLESVVPTGPESETAAAASHAPVGPILTARIAA
jgi:hypothetical protein